MGWKYFFFGTADPGNGGPLLQPRGQTSVFYKVGREVPVWYLISKVIPHYLIMVVGTAIREGQSEVPVQRTRE